MNKILVKLYIPTIGLQYDIWISPESYIENVIKLIIKGLNELTYGEYNPQKMPNLYNKKTGLAYSPYDVIADVNIVSGTELMLI